MAQNRILHTSFPARSTVLPFLWFFFFFWSRAYHPLPFSFNFNFPARYQAHDALKSYFTVRKPSNERHLGWRSIFRGRSFSWTRGTGPASEESCVLDRTYFGSYVPFYHFPWGNVIFSSFLLYFCPSNTPTRVSTPLSRVTHRGLTR